jgi:hypothetical protein
MTVPPTLKPEEEVSLLEEATALREGLKSVDERLKELKK